MTDKEKIYDELISPLMKQIIDVCKREGIPMFAEFQYTDNDFCTSCIAPDGRHVNIELYNVLSKCKEEKGTNIDKFMFHIARNHDNASSIVLKLMGREPVIK